MRRKRRKALLDKFGDSGFRAIQRWFLVPDVAKAERRGENLGKLLYIADKKHRARAKSNLELALPELSATERERICKAMYLHFGRVAGDFLRSPLRTEAEVLESTVFDNQPILDQVDNYAKGVIAVTAHFGNWERFAHWCTASGRPISVVARDANQSGVQDEMQKIREQTGMVVLSRGNAAKAILQRLRRKELVGLLADQNSGECFVPFFGHPTGTVMGPAVLHQRTSALLVPAYYARIGVGRYRLIIRPPVDPDNQMEDPSEITAVLNAELESVIREYPEQWLWMHDRWKASRRKGLL